MQDRIREAWRIVVEYGEFLEYDTTLQIKDSGKQPIAIKMKYATFPTSFAPMPPVEHIIRAKDFAELVLKLNRWFGKYGYNMC